MKQTILGSGGAIGNELAKELKSVTSDIRLVSRNPQKVNETDEVFAADLLDFDQMKTAIKGSSIVYSVVGFKYKLKVWQENWPKYVDNLLKACEAEKAKLVFFDNIYMYDKAYLSNMTEDTPINPSSEKGKIRAAIANKILAAHQMGKVETVIARAADFYGPGDLKTSILTVLTFDALSKGKTANWLANADKIHSFTYTPDAAKALVILGSSPEAYGQVWHLPTDSSAYTGKSFIELIAKEMGVNPKYRVTSKRMLQLIGLFVPIMKEMVEMNYQYEQDYFFNSQKFDSHFGFKPTSYQDGIREIVRRDYK